MLLRKLAVFILLSAGRLYATTYYANGLTGQNIDYTTAGAGWYTIQGVSCVATGTSVAVGSFANGDVLDANGCTSMAVDVDPGAATGASAGVCGTVTVTVTLETNATNGGGFTYATATNIVIHANVTAIKTTTLVITGSTGGGTICGNILGSATTGSLDGVSDTHTVVTMYVVGNITGGSSSFDDGYFANSSGPMNIAGNATAGSCGGCEGFVENSSGPVTIVGNCTGSNSNTGIGCETLNGGTGIITLTGNIINGIKGSGEVGAMYYTPAATNYILSAKDSSYTLGTINTHSTLTPTDPGASNVRLGTVYGPNTGTLAVTSSVSNSGFAQ